MVEVGTTTVTRRNTPMKQAVKIKENVWWVGAVDWNLRDFHGYQTSRGGTYNAYLILDEKTTLVDNVRAAFSDEMIERIRSVCDPASIDVIIQNHGEPDHSGSLESLLALAPHAEVYASAPAGIRSLQGLYHGIKVNPVKTGDTLSIGKRTLSFIQTPLVHWPDNMVTYDSEDKILFSNDMFGQHIAGLERFDDNVSLETVMHEARTYYANIILPYGPSVNKALAHIKALDLEMIATSHGVIWRDHIKDIIALYEHLASGEKLNKAVVVYDTMWGSTEKMAVSITEAFHESGVSCVMRKLSETPMSDIMEEIMDAKIIAVGSSTLNSGMLPSVGGFLTYMKGLVPKGYQFLAFGSYGWGLKGPKDVDTALEAMGQTRLMPLETVMYNPTSNDLSELKTRLKAAIMEFLAS
jgi:flavorubredoxin